MTTRDVLDDLHQADLSLAEAWARERHRPAVRLLGQLSELADQPQLAALCGLTALAGLVRRDRRLVSTGGLMLAAHGLATLAKAILKAKIDRTRPKIAIEEQRYDAGTGRSQDGDDQSFPSGHTAGAVAVATIVSVRHPVAAVPAAALAVAASAIQVPRGKHYPLDLAAGFAIGAAAAAIVLAAAHPGRRHRRALR